MLESPHLRRKYSESNFEWPFWHLLSKLRVFAPLALYKLSPYFHLVLRMLNMAANLYNGVKIIQFLRISLPYFPLANLIIFVMLSCICLYCRFERKFV